MYGMIHQAARELAIRNLGEPAWEALLDEAGFEGRHFIGVEYYADADTMRLVGLISERLGLGIEDTLHEFGRFWVDFAGASAYGRVLQMAGDDLETFIMNLDRMHASIKSNMPKAALPGFEVVESSAEAIRVLYRSERRGLAPFVKGILSLVAERFGERVEINYAEFEDGVLFDLARVTVDA